MQRTMLNIAEVKRVRRADDSKSYDSKLDEHVSNHPQFRTKGTLTASFKCESEGGQGVGSRSACEG